MQFTIHGSSLSPWVRRVAVVLDEKGIDFTIKRYMPSPTKTPEFYKINPLGKVPVLEIDGRFLPDSLAICTYLESVAPQPQLFPDNGWDRGWMLWLCDFLATGVFSKVEAPLFIQRFVNPTMYKKEPNHALIEAALEAMPKHFDYLEEQLNHGKNWLLGDQISLADLTAGCIFINLLHAGEPVDAPRWPLLAAYVDRVLARPSLAKVIEAERKSIGAASPMFR